MAAGNVRFRSIYYNTTGAAIEWKIEILDTEPVTQIFNFESTEPVISFEGLTQDLKPGIYPSTLKFGMYVRDAPFAKGGVTYGPSSSIINDLLTSNEGRFLVKVYRDNVLYYCGIILPDQSQYEDSASPYLLSITVADGLYRWKDKSYLSLFGRLEYATCEEYDEQPGSPSSTPLDTCLEGTEWVLVEHYSVAYGDGQEPEGVQRTSTYARRVQYATESPGTGWVSQGEGLWAKEITYSNEVIVNETDLYHLTRDIDNSTHRVITDLFENAINAIGLGDEYASPSAMWDTSSEWYEHNMADLTADPLSQTRVHEEQLFDIDVFEAIEQVCKLFFLRVYYSTGRYHFEQLSIRDSATFNRWPYESDGTPKAVESVTLDVDMAASNIRVQAGGSFRILSPLKSAEVKISLDTDNLLEREFWDNEHMGNRYLGRISRADGTQNMRIVLNLDLDSWFEKATMGVLSESDQALSGVHKYTFSIQARIKDTELGTTYYLTGDSDVTESSYEDGATWVSATPYLFVKKFEMGSFPNNTFSQINNKQDKHIRLVMLSGDLPGTEGSTFDVNVTVNGTRYFVNEIGRTYWAVTNSTKYRTKWRFDLNRLTFEDEDGNQINGRVERVYFVENSSGNSLKIENPVIWADTGQTKKSVEVETADGWRRSLEWSIGGTGTAEPLLSLCASEIMSLRVTPKKIYSGAFLSGTIDPEDRILRGTTYYLPLRADLNTDLDGFSGDFLEIAKTSPPAVDLIDIVLDESNDPQIGIGNPGGGGGNPNDLPLAFETNEEIIAASTLTECDIVNTQGWTIAAGTDVKIVNTSNGNAELVTLTQDIEPNDTIMYFQSHTFLYGYPDASPIILDAMSPPSLSDLNVFTYNNKNFTGNDFAVPQFNWLYFKNMPSNTFHRKVRLSRNGVEMIMTRSTGIVGNWPDYYRIDIDAKKFIFNGNNCIPFDDEWLKIDIDLKR